MHALEMGSYWRVLNRIMVLDTLGFPGGSAVKKPPAMQQPYDMRVRSLGQEDPLGEGMATHSSIPGEFHGQRSLVGYSQ